MDSRDISIGKRLLLSNFIMIFIPVAFTLVVSIAIFLGLHFGNINRAALISFIWPESSGPTLSVQFELSRLCVRADQYDGDMKPLFQSGDHLEDQGLRVAIWKDGRFLYVTNGTDGQETMDNVQRKVPAQSTASWVWSDQGIDFSYVSTKTGIVLAVTGNVPLHSHTRVLNLHTKDILKVAFYVLTIATVILTICVGLYLARKLSRQIVQPLEELRDIAGDISRGNLEHPVTVKGHDEISDTCRSFENMRLQLKAAGELRDKYDRNRKELIAGISHDLATPLTRIEGYASGLKDGIADTAEKRRHYVAMILDTSKMMTRLVRTLFLFSKFDLGQVEFCWENVDLCGYLEDYTGEQAEHFRHQGLDISYKASVDEAVVAMDRIHFQRVVENIIGNSVKYKDGDEGHLAISLDAAGDGAVRLTFADDGRGVGENDLPKLFDSFYRTDKARSNVAKGSGLGLAVAKQIIDEMKGKIWAEQTQPKGLTICIELPVQKEGNHHEAYTDH